ncbi:MAG: sulfite exporter TauE/SafE family protein, partial [Candidatus Obscuribacterales bacterium]|nr:sulfite exporter TauE/SafE family protein [Candidatus Obscuribacterales bacterium]
MTELNLSIVLLLSSFLIGILGAMSGLGGGSILTPVLYLFLGVDLRYAMGSSLIAAIATSSGAAAAYVKEGYSNL